MMKTSELFTTQLVAFQAARDALVSAIGLLGDEARTKAMTPSDLAIAASITRQAAQQILDGDSEPGLLADSRLKAGADLIEQIYQDLDSWRHGLLMCSMRSATEIVIMMTDPVPSHREHYEQRATALGFTLDWIRPAFSLRELLDRVQDMDQRAKNAGVAPPRGRITRNGAVVETPSVALTDDIDSGDLPGIQGSSQIGPHPTMDWDWGDRDQ